MVGRFLDSLLGRSKPIKPRRDNLFALSNAYVTLTSALGMMPGERAGVCFRPPEAAAFARLKPDISRLLAISAKETESQAEMRTDSYGFLWAVLVDPEFEDLLATTHVVTQMLEDEGFGESLLAAMFKFTVDQRPVYLVYNYKRGTFYPFVPLPGEQRRDNAYELRLRAALDKDLPMEPDLERWYPLWGAPV